MRNSLSMRTDAPYSLNFLIYLQNIYINQKQTEEEFRFPYLAEQVMFSSNFEENFKELWQDVSIKLSKDNSNGRDLILFYDENEIIYEKLFLTDSNNLKKYKEIYTSFRVWWGSYAGSFAIERSIDDPCHNLYLTLTSALKKNKIDPINQLNIHLIYDECLVTNTECYPYYTVLSIQGIHANHQELVSKLQRCIS